MRIQPIQEKEDDRMKADHSIQDIHGNADENHVNIIKIKVGQCEPNLFENDIIRHNKKWASELKQ